MFVDYVLACLESVSQEGQGKVSLDSWEETRTSFIVQSTSPVDFQGKGNSSAGKRWSESHLHNLSACLRCHWIILPVEIELQDPS